MLFPPLGVDDDDDDEVWRQGVEAAWPKDIFAQSYRVAPTSVDDWLQEQLANSSGVEHLLCLSIDSWVTTSGISAAEGEYTLGEAVAVLRLRRGSQPAASDHTGGWRLYPAQTTAHDLRSNQHRKHTVDIESVIHPLLEKTDIRLDQLGGLVSEGMMSGKRFSQWVAFQSVRPPAENELQMANVSALSGQVGHAAMVAAPLSFAYLLALGSQQDAVLALDRYCLGSTSAWLIERSV